MRQKRTHDLEGYLLERARQTCEYEEDMSFSTKHLEELIDVLDPKQMHLETSCYSMPVVPIAGFELTFGHHKGEQP